MNTNDRKNRMRRRTKALRNVRISKQKAADSLQLPGDKLISKFVFTRKVLRSLFNVIKNAKAKAELKSSKGVNGLNRRTRRLIARQIMDWRTFIETMRKNNKLQEVIVFKQRTVEQ